MEYMLMPLKRYADFSGRSRRMEFWMWQVFQVLVYVAVTILMMLLGGGAMMMMGSADPNTVAAAGGGILLIGGLYLIYALAVFIPSLAVAVRRLHDTNRSGWWILAPVVPYALVLVAGGMAVSSPDSAGAAGGLALVGMAAAMILALVLLVFYFLEGTKGPNRYGADPKGGANDEVFA